MRLRLTKYIYRVHGAVAHRGRSLEIYDCLVTPAWVGRSVASVCLYVCLSVRAVKGKRLDINTKLGTRVLYSSRSACRGQKVKDQGHAVTKTVKVAGC